jgi:geranylgeranyl pyrophosphate synthase
MPAACAVEMLHTYSLIHDDLPCMDNDALRRGKPSNHIAFNEYTAVLAGDALQAEAFGMILRSPLPDKVRADCAMYLAASAGVDGICGGQYMDLALQGAELTDERISDISMRKTGSLIVNACLMGVSAAGGSDEQLDAAGHFGAAVGLAFQLRDDLLDLSEDTGKPTLASILGASECERRIEKLSVFAKDTISRQFDSTDFLLAVVDWLSARET